MSSNTQYKTLAIIPARSGSKGIANKNIKKLGNYPLLCWTAKAVQQIRHHNVLAILSTDSYEYADVGRSCNLMVPFIRPEQFATDTASAYEVAMHAVNWFEQQYGKKPQQLMWLQPTSPFRSPKLIDTALELMIQHQADAVLGCKRIPRDLTTLFQQQDKFIQALASNQAHQIRRQDVNALLTPNGAMYLIKTDGLIKTKGFYPAHTVPLVMDNISSHDIDEPEDWLMAEAYVDKQLVWLSQ